MAWDKDKQFRFDQLRLAGARYWLAHLEHHILIQQPYERLTGEQ